MPKDISTEIKENVITKRFHYQTPIYEYVNEIKLFFLPRFQKNSFQIANRFKRKQTIKSML
jgi:hypothetical protein